MTTTRTVPEMDVDALRGWIGREDATTDILTDDLVRKFRASLDQAPGDTDFGAPAPGMIHFCLGLQAARAGELGTDGHPRRGGFLPPVPLPRRLLAGGRVVFHDALRIGDPVRRVARIDDVTVKEGRTGTLCFVTVSHVFEVGGRPVIEEQHDIVYRDFAGGASNATPPAAPSGDHRREIAPSPTLLFRYSALTFNSHRIHYDRPYATEVEGYPGLVVHGPLQATLLFNYATEIQGLPPARFTFRSLSPLFDNANFLLNAEAKEGGLKLWTARPGGPVATAAEADLP